jgi:glucokinase
MGSSSARRKIQSITASEMRDINRSTILELIRRNGPVGRSQIAEEHNVSLPTVMRIVEDLIANGLVVEEKTKEWSGGRRRARVRFNGSQHLVLSVDLGGELAYGAVADLSGEVCHEIYCPSSPTDSDESLELLYDLIDRLIEKSSDIGLPVRGIAVGIPGTVDPNQGVVRRSPYLCWHGFPLKDHLKARYRFPVSIENNVNLAALGETWFGSAGIENNLVLLALGSIIGAGVVINGSVYTGAHNMAGQVANLLPGQAHNGAGQFEASGMERLISGPALVRQARRALTDQLSPDELEALTAEFIFKSAEKEEPWALQIRESFIESLAQMLIAIGVVLDPEVILLTISLTETPERLLEPLLKRLQSSGGLAARVQLSRLGGRAIVMGAIIQLLRITSNYYTIQKYN